MEILLLLFFIVILYTPVQTIEFRSSIKNISKSFFCLLNKKTVIYIGIRKQSANKNDLADDHVNAFFSSG